MNNESRGGVNPWQQIASLLERHRENVAELRAEVKERLRVKRAVRIEDVFYAVRFKGTTYRGQTPAELLEKLPKLPPRTPRKKKEKPANE